MIGGAVNVLVGENGAGKSTLMKVIAGVVQPTSGRILIDGKEVAFASRDDAIAAGIGMVFQELNLFPNLTVAENIFIGRETMRGIRGIDRRAQEEAARVTLRRLEAAIRPDAFVGDLPIGQQQLVENAKALAQNARVLIMDEPTSALSAAETATLFGVIRGLTASGVGIVYISHRLEELIRIGDAVTVMRDGRVTGHGWIGEVDVRWIIRQMIGQDAKDFARAEDHRIGEEVLRAEDICLPSTSGGWKVDHVSLSVRVGEVLGVYGLMGAGRSELLECLIGRQPYATGRITVAGRPVRERDVAGRIRRGIALIPEDRQREGLIADLSIATNMTLASIEKFCSAFHIRREREGEAVRGAIRALSIKGPLSGLSGLVDERRQPAEGRHRQSNADRAEGSADGRAEPGDRCRSEVGRVLNHAAACRGRARDHPRDFGSRRGDGALRSDRGDEQRKDHADLRTRRSDGGRHHYGIRNRASHASRDSKRGRHPMSASTRSPDQKTGSIGLLLLQLRTFIALFAVLIFFGIAAPNFASTANIILMSKQVALKRDPLSRHDVRDYYRRDRPVGRIDRRTVRNDRGRPHPLRGRYSHRLDRVLQRARGLRHRAGDRNAAWRH